MYILIVETPPVSITPEMAIKAYAAVDKVIVPRYEPRGLELSCYDNVREIVEADGGGFVPGWLVRTQEEGPNLDAHAIWRTDTGEYVEVTPLNSYSDKFAFLPDPRVDSDIRGIMLLCRHYEQSSVFATFIEHEMPSLRQRDYRAVKVPQAYIPTMERLRKRWIRGRESQEL